MSGRFHNERMAEILDSMKRGRPRTPKQWADDLGVSTDEVYALAKKHGLETSIIWTHAKKKRGNHPDDFAIRSYKQVAMELAARGDKITHQACQQIGVKAMCGVSFGLSIVRVAQV